MRRAAALLAATGLLASGCGGDNKPADGEQIKTTLTTYYKAFGDGDAETACNQLAKNTLASLEKAAGGKLCPKVLEEALKRPDYAKLAPKLANVRVTMVNIVGDKASAEASVPGTPRPVPVALQKEGGSWKIASPIGSG